MTDINLATMPEQQWPFKLRLLHALTDCIKEVTPANGYTFDLADFDPGDGVMTPRVYRGRSWFGESDPVPMVSVLEPIEESDYVFTPPSDASTGTYDWPLLVQGFVSDDPQNPTDPAYWLMHDVRRRLVCEKRRTRPGMRTTDPLGSSQWGLPGRVSDLKISTGKVRPADDVSARAYFWMVVTPTVTEDAE